MKNRVYLIGVICVLFCTAVTCQSLERIVIHFSDNVVVLTSKQESEIEGLADIIEDIKTAEGFDSYKIHLVSRSTEKEYCDNRYIGVSRALNVRNEFMEYLDLRNEDFYIIDLAIADTLEGQGIQVFIVNPE